VTFDPIQAQCRGHWAFELPIISEAVHAGGDDRSPLAGLSGFRLAFVYEIKFFHAEEFYFSVKECFYF